MPDELIEQLQAGVCMDMKQSSDALGWYGTPDVTATNELMARAAGEIKRLKPLEGTDDHPEHRCDRCGGRNVRSWYADSDVWNQVAGEYSILCPICFAELAKLAGMRNLTWRLSIRDGAPELTKLRVQLYVRMKKMAELSNENERLRAVVAELRHQAECFFRHCANVYWARGNCPECRRLREAVEATGKTANEREGGEA